jgi:selenocysteine lyase/cysteine desulfurase
MQDYRQEFADFSPTIYLDCAYQGPFPTSTVARIQQAIELKFRPYRLEPAEYFALPNRVRSRIATLLGADPAEIALTNSATQGIGVVASGMKFAPGDEVVIAEGNFPGNLFTWLHLRRLGVRVHVVRPAGDCLRPEDVAPVLSRRVRVLALDWVSYITGARIDLAALGELAHRCGAIFVVDGTQGVGALDLQVRELPIDVLVVAAYKWLLGPYGTGFAFLTPNVRDRLEVPVVNWMSVKGSENFDALPMEAFTLARDAKVFDVPETSNFLNLYGLEGSLEFLERVGVKTVTAHCRHLLDLLAEGLSTRGFHLTAAALPESHSTILAFQADSLDQTEKLHARLKAQDVAVSLRQGRLRVSPHLYNVEGDIDRLLELVS